MSRGRSETLTGREAEIMDVIWRLGQASADQVREGLNGKPHDSTIRTLLRVLESKGYVSHEVSGKAYLYKPVLDRRKAQHLALGSLLAKFFGGSAEDLVLRLIEEEHITPEQLDELRRGVPEAAKKNDSKRNRRAGRGDNSETDLGGEA